MKRIIRRFGYKLLFFPIVFSILLILGAALLIVKDMENPKPAGDPVKTTEQQAKTEKKKPTQTTANQQKNLEKEFKEGSFVAGSDIEPGEYLVWESEKSPYLEIKDASGHIKISLTFHKRVYVTISEGETVTLKHGTAKISSSCEPYSRKGNYYPEGQYLTGKDIKAGKYVIRPNSESEEGSYSICSDSTGSLASISQSEIISEEKTISLKNGEYISLTGLEISESGKK